MPPGQRLRQRQHLTAVRGRVTRQCGHRAVPGRGLQHLAQQLQAWQMSGSNYSLLVGGPDGLSRQCLDRASARWSLSDLTLPHPLVRVLLAEQLYRAWTITVNHPYHRE